MHVFQMYANKRNILVLYNTFITLAIFRKCLDPRDQGSDPEVCDKLYDDVIKWKHFPRYWPFVRGIYRSSVKYKGQWRRALNFSLICTWINGWVNNRKAGDFRRYRVHYDVTVMAGRSDPTMLSIH